MDNLGQLGQRYLVAFIAHPDYYQVAVALAEVDALGKLYTDLYTPDRLLQLAERLPSSVRHKVVGRHTKLIPSSYVRSPHVARAMGVAVRSRLGAGVLGPRNDMMERLGCSTGRYARRSGSAAIVYNHLWLGYLDGLGAARRTALDVIVQMHPMPRQIRRILAEERQRNTVVAPPGEEELLTEQDVENYELQVMKADAAIVASRFVARGLEEIGYPRERIHIVPYGGDRVVRSPSAPAVRRRDQDGPLRLLFVGQLLTRKGWHHLVDAVARFTPKEVVLTMVCREQQDRDALGSPPPNVNVVGEVNESQLVQLYLDHDVFAMPSLIEGFGLVYLEAMALGLPIICTENTGGPDVISDGEEGVVVEAGSTEALYDAIATLAADPDRVRRMGERALVTVRTLTWQRFRVGIRDALSSIERSEPAPSGRRSPFSRHD